MQEEERKQNREEREPYFRLGPLEEGQGGGRWVAANKRHETEARNDETGVGEEGGKSAGRMMSHLQAMEEMLRDLTKSVRDLEQVNEERLPSSSDAGTGRGDWKWENNSWWLRCGSGRT